MGQAQGVTHLEISSHEKSWAKHAEPQGKVEEVHRDFGSGKGQVYPVLSVEKWKQWKWKNENEASPKIHPGN